MKYSVSVALCTYNGSRFIEEQLESILRQTEIPDEIIIGDDLSKDNTLDLIINIMKKYKFENYKILKSEKNLGVVRNFERTINNCSGDIVFTADQDDIWKLDKISIIKQVFISNPDVSLVFTNAALVDENLISLKLSLWETLNFNPSEKGKVNLLKILLNRCVVTGATMAIKRDFLIKNKISFSEHWLHDGWLAMLATVHDEIFFLPEQLILYRQHDSNVVGANNKNLLSKVKSYLGNIKKIENIRLNRFNRYKDVSNYIIKNNLKNKNSTQWKEVNACCDYWESKIMLQNQRKKISVQHIVSDWKQGKYKRYSNGNLAAIRDLISIFL